MSIAIQMDDVQSVLLADGWHEVQPGTFDLDAYEFMEGDGCRHLGGQSGVCATGFEFGTEKGRIAGPLTAILAVRFKRTET